MKTLLKLSWLRLKIIVTDFRFETSIAPGPASQEKRLRLYNQLMRQLHEQDQLLRKL